MSELVKNVPLVEEQLTLDRGDRKLPVYVVGPKGVRCPGLIVVHEIFGLNDHIKDLCNRFAAQGLRAFATDLFEGRPNLPANRDDLDAMRGVWANIPDSELIADLQALFQVVTDRDDIVSDTIGTIGYCMGGAIALMFACSTPYVIFCIDYYGRVRYPQLSDLKPKHPIDYAQGNICPTLGVFSGIDPLIPPEDVQQFEESLKRVSPDVEVKVYPNAPHAFFNDRRENYRAEEAQDAWQLTIKFIDRQISVKHT